MSNAALAMTPASATKWTVISGPMKGTVRLMNAPVFVVGRSPECELVLINDPKVSRRHAQIESNGYGCDVISLNDKNPVLVNGKPRERATLADGDVVSFGETEVQVNMTSTGGGSQIAIVPDMPLAYPGINGSPAPKPRGRPRTPKKAQSNYMRWIMYGGVALLAYFILSPSKPKKPEVQMRTEQMVQAEVDKAAGDRDRAEAENVKRVDSSMNGRQAQENYVRGFRDYKKGQFERALTSFQACLALNPEHVLCNRYFRLSQRKFDDLVQYQFTLGRKYKEQNQFRACRSSFRNVMVMIKDANSAIYQEAKVNYEACDALTEGRF